MSILTECIQAAYQFLTVWKACRGVCKTRRMPDLQKRHHQPGEYFQPGDFSAGKLMRYRVCHAQRAENYALPDNLMASINNGNKATGDALPCGKRYRAGRHTTSMSVAVIYDDADA